MSISMAAHWVNHLETKAKRGLEAVFLLKGRSSRAFVLPTENVKRLNVGETLNAGVTPMVQGHSGSHTAENAMIERKNSEGLWIKGSQRF